MEVKTPFTISQSLWRLHATHYHCWPRTCNYTGPYLLIDTEQHLQGRLYGDGCQPTPNLYSRLLQNARGSGPILSLCAKVDNVFHVTLSATLALVTQ